MKNIFYLSNLILIIYVTSTSHLSAQNISSCSIGGKSEVTQDTQKFKLLGNFTTGFAIPTADFKDAYASGSGLEISAYKIFSRTTGLGIEIQYNNFNGRVFYYTEPYTNYKINTDGYNLTSIKLNLMFGDIRPEIDFVLYLLFGVGMQFCNEGNINTTNITYNSSNTISNEGISETSIMYGIGIGSFYKVTQKIGINIEAQFNSLSDIKFITRGTDDKSDGFYSFKAGIMYTIF